MDPQSQRRDAEEEQPQGIQSMKTRAETAHARARFTSRRRRIPQTSCDVITCHVHVVSSICDSKISTSNISAPSNAPGHTPSSPSGFESPHYLPDPSLASSSAQYAAAQIVYDKTRTYDVSHLDDILVITQPNARRAYRSCAGEPITGQNVETVLERVNTKMVFGDHAGPLNGPSPAWSGCVGCE